MPPTYQFYHLHLVSKDPETIARYYHMMFGAKVIKSLTPEGKPRIDLDLNGLSIYIVQAKEEENLPSSPPGRYIGLDHFGLLVKNMDEAVAELKRKGAEFAAEPITVRPGLRIAFIRGPENVRIEIAERT
jgi:lactoylglutathione lyase